MGDHQAMEEKHRDVLRWRMELDAFAGKGDVVAVMGRHDNRSDWIRSLTDSGDPTLKSRDRPDLSKRVFITRAKSPVGNKFEKDKNLSRLEQIDAFRRMAHQEWVVEGAMPPKVAEWLDARVADINAGAKIDLVCDCRTYARRRFGMIKKEQPHDCHGYALRALIFWRLGWIEAIDLKDHMWFYRKTVEGPRPGEDDGTLDPFIW